LPSTTGAYIGDMAGFYKIKIDVDGRSVTGEWTHMMGGKICVRCQPFGRLVVPVGHRRPEAWAKRVLEIIVRCYYRRRRQERARMEAEAQRLGRRARTRLSA